MLGGGGLRPGADSPRWAGSKSVIGVGGDGGSLSTTQVVFVGHIAKAPLLLGMPR